MYFFLEDWYYLAKSASSGLRNRLCYSQYLFAKFVSIRSLRWNRCFITGWFRSTPLDPLGQLLKDSLDGVKQNHILSDFQIANNHI